MSLAALAFFIVGNLATNPPAPTILINIDKAKQRMTVLLDGVQRYDWPVWTGKAGYSTPSGSFTPLSMNKVWYSKEWDNAPMPHAIFFMKDGHAIHGSYEVKHLGKAVSHGCVRISPQNATILYTLVEKTGAKEYPGRSCRRHSRRRGSSGEFSELSESFQSKRSEISEGSQSRRFTLLCRVLRAAATRLFQALVRRAIALETRERFTTDAHRTNVPSGLR